VSGIPTPPQRGPEALTMIGSGGYACEGDFCFVPASDRAAAGDADGGVARATSATPGRTGD